MTAPASFTDVLRVRTFRVIFSAEMQSIVGDQLARIALAVFVFAQTGSDSATTLTFGLTYLPAVFGGFVLARLGDRGSRRAVMVGCDLLRAAAFAAMALPGLPLAAIGALLVLAVFIGPAFSASAVSTLADQLTGPQFRVASGLRLSASQLAQVTGYAVGGALVGLLGARETLALNAATYLVSAAAVLFGLRTARAGTSESRTAAETSIQRDRHLGDERVLAALLRDPRARTWLLLSLTAGLFVVAEALAVPYAEGLGASAAETGLLLAAIPLGAVVGVLILTRVLPSRCAEPSARWLAVVTGVPLAITPLAGSVPAAAALWFVSGCASAFQVEMFISLITWSPVQTRSGLVGMCSSLLLAAQGLGPLIFGLVASATGPAHAIAWAGIAGTLVALLIVAVRLRAARRPGEPRHRRA